MNEKLEDQAWIMGQIGRAPGTCASKRTAVASSSLIWLSHCLVMNAMTPSSLRHQLKI